MGSLVCQCRNSPIFIVVQRRDRSVCFFCVEWFFDYLTFLREKAQTGTVSVKYFYLRRAFRLLPAISVFFMVIAAMMYLGWLSPAWKSLLIAVFYLYNFVPGRYYFSELGHTWSLGVEEQFYLLWPWAIRWVAAPGLPLVLGILLVACIVAPFLLPGIVFDWNGKQYVFARFFWDLQRFFIPAIAPVILGGYAAWLYLYSGKIRLISQRGGLLPSALILFSAQLLLPETVFAHFPPYLFKGAGASLALLHIAYHQEGGLARLLEWRPLAWLGSISYGVYVWQGLFLRTGPGGRLWIQQFPQNVVLTLLAAILSYYLLEKHFLHWKKRFSPH